MLGRLHVDLLEHLATREPLESGLSVEKVFPSTAECLMELTSIGWVALDDGCWRITAEGLDNWGKRSFVDGLVEV